MDVDDDVGTLLVSIDETACKGLGAAVKQHFDQHGSLLQRVPLSNKLGKTALVDKLNVQ